MCINEEAAKFANLTDGEVDVIFLQRIGDIKGLSAERKHFLLSIDINFQKHLEIIKKDYQKNIRVEWISEIGSQETFKLKNIGTEYIIQINSRFVLTLLLLSHRLFSNGNYQIDGFSSPNGEIDQTLKEIKPNLIDLGVEFKESEEFCRRLIAQQFAMGSAQLLFFHEVFHIISEHIAFKKKYYELAKNGNEDAALNLQALEADADRMAMLQLLDLQKNVISRQMLSCMDFMPEIKPVYKLIYADNYEMCFWIGQIFYFSFKFPEKNWNDITIKSLQHPPNMVRAYLLSLQLCRVLYKELTEDERSKKSYELTMRTIMWVEALISMMTGEPVKFSIQNMDLSQLFEYASKVERRMAELSEEIIKSNNIIAKLPENILL